MAFGIIRYELIKDSLGSKIRIARLVKSVLRRFPVPCIVISKCIEFENVRWDGGVVSSNFVKQLKPHIDPILVCPEVEIGLGVPRKPLRLVISNGRTRIVQPHTNKDLTKRMEEFIRSFFDSLPEVDGFILKNRSPTSAIRDARIYPNSKKTTSPIGRGPGIFGAAILKEFPHLAIEDEGRLRNPRIKEHFLTKIFALASFREIRTSESIQSLVKFHTENKLLLMAYSQRNMRLLGRVVATRNQGSFEETVKKYENRLLLALRRPPRCGSNINVLMHSLGYFSKRLSRDEKRFFLGSLRKYKEGHIPLSILITIVRSWAIRFEEDYLLNQTLFEPYPEDLINKDAFTTYCDGKDYWK